MYQGNQLDEIISSIIQTDCNVQPDHDIDDRISWMSKIEMIKNGIIVTTLNVGESRSEPMPRCRKIYMEVAAATHEVNHLLQVCIVSMTDINLPNNT